MSGQRSTEPGLRALHRPASPLDIELDDRKTVHWECQVCAARNVRPLRVHKLLTDVNQALTTFTHCEIQILCVDCGKLSISQPIDIREAADLTSSPVLRRYIEQLSTPAEIRDDSEELRHRDIERRSKVAKIVRMLSGTLVGMHIVGVSLPLLIAWMLEHFTLPRDAVRVIIVVALAYIFLIFLGQRRRAARRLCGLTRSYYANSSGPPAVRKALRLLDLGAPASIFLPVAAVVPLGIRVSEMNLQHAFAVSLPTIIFLVIAARISYVTFRYRRKCRRLEADAAVPIRNGLFRLTE